MPAKIRIETHGVVFGIFLLCFLFLSGHAQAQQPTTPTLDNVPQKVAVETPPKRDKTVKTICYFYSTTGESDLALGVSVAVNELLASNDTVQPVGISHFLDYAKRIKQIDDLGRYTTKAIPLLNLQLDVERIVFGDLGFVDGVFNAQLHTFDLKSGRILKTEIVQDAAGPQPETMDKIVQSVFNLYGIPQKPKMSAESLGRIDYSTLTVLGRAESLLQTDINQAIVEWNKVLLSGFLPKGAGEREVGYLLEKEEGKLKSSSKALIPLILSDWNGAEALLEQIKDDKTKALFHLIIAMHRGAEAKDLEKLKPQMGLLSGSAASSVYVSVLKRAKGSEEAIHQALEEAISRGTSDPRLWQELGDVREKNNEREKAANLLEEAGKRFQNQHSPLYATRAFIKSAYLEPTLLRLQNVDTRFLDSLEKKLFEKLVGKLYKPDSVKASLLQYKALLLNGKMPEAEQVIEEAFKRFPQDADVALEYGDYYVKYDLDLDKCSEPLDTVRRRRQNDVRARLLLAEAYMKSGEGFYDRAASMLRELAAKVKTDRKIARSVFELYLGIQRIPDAEKVLKIIQSLPGAKADVLFDQAQLALAKKDKENAKKLIASATLLEPEYKKLGEILLSEKKQEQKEQKRVREKVRVNLSWPKLESMLESIQVLPQHSYVINITPKEIPLKDRILSTTTNLFNYDLSLIGDEIDRLLRANTLINKTEPVGSFELGTPGKPVTLENLNKILEHGEKETAVFAYRYKLENTESGTEILVEMFFYAKGEKEVKTIVRKLNTGLERVSSFNSFVVVLPGFVLIFMLTWFVNFQRKGFGSLTVRIAQDASNTTSYFGVRVARTSLKKTPFDVESYKGMKDIEKESFETKVLKIFSSLNPLVQIVQNNVAIFNTLPVGQYRIYISGLVVDYSLKEVAKIHEIEREIIIERDSEKEIEIDLTQHVTINVEVVNLIEKSGGDFTEKPADGATIHVNENPELTKYSLQKGKCHYSLPRGRYRFVSSLDDHIGYEDLVIDSDEAREIKIVLKPEAEVSIPPMEFSIDLEAPGSEHEVTDSSGFEDEEQDDLQQDESGFMQIDALIEQEFAGDNTLQTPDPDTIEPISSLDDGSDVPASRSSEIGMYNTGLVTGTDAGFLEPPAEDEIPEPEIEEPEEDEETRIERLTEQAQRLLKGEQYADAARIFLELKEFDKAMQAAQNAGDAGLNYLVYGYNYMEQRQYDEALTMFQYAEDIPKQIDVLVAMGRASEAEELKKKYNQETAFADVSVDDLQKAGNFSVAAYRLARDGNYLEAATLYEQAEMPIEAADAYLKSGNKVKAAELYEKAGKYLSVAQLLEEKGSNEKLFEMYEKGGEYFKAAQGYKDLDLKESLLKLGWTIEPGHKDFLRVIALSCTILYESNDKDSMLNLYRKIADEGIVNADNAPEYYQFAYMVQNQGYIREALAIFGSLDSQYPNYSDVKKRVEKLIREVEKLDKKEDAKKQGMEVHSSAAEVSESSSSGSIPLGPPPEKQKSKTMRTMKKPRSSKGNHRLCRLTLPPMIWAKSLPKKRKAKKPKADHWKSISRQSAMNCWMSWDVEPWAS